VLGREALSKLTSKTEMEEVVGPLKYLALASAEAGDKSISKQLRKKYESGTDTLGENLQMTAAGLLRKLETVPKSDVQQHLQIAAKARAFKSDGASVARKVYQTIIERFPEDKVTCDFARTGIDQLDNPEHYMNLRGAFITDFATHSIGRDAGLSVGDVILAYDSAPIDTTREVVEAIARAKTDRVTVLAYRKGTLVRIECPKGPLGVELQGF
jgi:C-terminal processing protease CtpA/Prc